MLVWNELNVVSVGNQAASYILWQRYASTLSPSRNRLYDLSFAKSKFLQWSFFGILSEHFSSKATFVLVVINLGFFPLRTMDLLHLSGIVTRMLSSIWCIIRSLFRRFRNGVVVGESTPITKSMCLGSELISPKIADMSKDDVDDVGVEVNSFHKLRICSLVRKDNLIVLFLLC